MKLDINNYPGAKNGSDTYQNIINRIPPHDTYIEPLVGSGAIFFNKNLAQFSFLSDLNKDVIWQLANSDFFDECTNWTHNNENQFTFIQNDLMVCLDHIDYRSTIDRTRLYKNRFIYLDPPYLKSTRKSDANIYLHEWTESDHITFLDYVNKIDCPVMISCYDSFLYEIELSHWNKFTFTSMTRSGPATETLYMNYEKPTKLHDYSYLGDDFTERQRINRKTNRLLQRFETLSVLERNKLIDALKNKYD